MAIKSPVISILLPVFNGEKTLRATMDSLMNQTFQNFEILVGIDGTKDQSKKIAESYNDPRIVIIEHPKNLGLANNLNAMILKANDSSKYFAMAEQDDTYVPERLQWQVDVMQENPSIGLVSGIAEFVTEGKSILFPGLLVYKDQFPQGVELFKYLYENQLKVVNTCMLWRKSVHDKYKLSFKDTYGNFNVDWNFMLRFSLIARVHGLQKVLVKMNRRGTNVSITKDKSTQHKASRQLLKDFYKEFPSIVTRELYDKALKKHREIELGHNSRLGILTKGLFYTFRYRDPYFITYIYDRFRKFLNGRY